MAMLVYQRVRWLKKEHKLANKKTYSLVSLVTERHRGAYVTSKKWDLMPLWPSFGGEANVSTNCQISESHGSFNLPVGHFIKTKRNLPPTHLPNFRHDREVHNTPPPPKQKTNMTGWKNNNLKMTKMYLLHLRLSIAIMLGFLEDFIVALHDIGLVALQT